MEFMDIHMEEFDFMGKNLIMNVSIKKMLVIKAKPYLKITFLYFQIIININIINFINTLSNVFV